MSQMTVLDMIQQTKFPLFEENLVREDAIVQACIKIFADKESCDIFSRLLEENFLRLLVNEPEDLEEDAEPYVEENDEIEAEAESDSELVSDDDENDIMAPHYESLDQVLVALALSSEEVKRKVYPKLQRQLDEFFFGDSQPDGDDVQVNVARLLINDAFTNDPLNLGYTPLVRMGTKYLYGKAKVYAEELNYPESFETYAMLLGALAGYKPGYLPRIDIIWAETVDAFKKIETPDDIYDSTEEIWLLQEREIHEKPEVKETFNEFADLFLAAMDKVARNSPDGIKRAAVETLRILQTNDPDSENEDIQRLTQKALKQFRSYIMPYAIYLETVPEDDEDEPVIDENKDLESVVEDDSRLFSMLCTASMFCKNLDDFYYFFGKATSALKDIAMNALICQPDGKDQKATNYGLMEDIGGCLRGLFDLDVMPFIKKSPYIYLHLLENFYEAVNSFKGLEGVGAWHVGLLGSDNALLMPALENADVYTLLTPEEHPNLFAAIKNNPSTTALKKLFDLPQNVIQEGGYETAVELVAENLRQAWEYNLHRGLCIEQTGILYEKLEGADPAIINKIKINILEYRDILKRTYNRDVSPSLKVFFDQIMEMGKSRMDLSSRAKMKPENPGMQFTPMH